MDLTSSLNDADSILVFSDTLFPILITNCSGCHGANQQPRFAVQNAQISHDVLLQFALINPQTPANSRVVQKIRGGHQNISQNVADQMQSAIEQWMMQVSSSPGGGPITAPELKASFSSIHALILVPKCVGCHNPQGVRPSEDYTNYTTTRSTGKISPGNAKGSEMYRECLSGAMPENALRLSAAELSAMETWINNGALNN
jgi:cytochrome c553